MSELTPAQKRLRESDMTARMPGTVSCFEDFVAYVNQSIVNPGRSEAAGIYPVSCMEPPMTAILIKGHGHRKTAEILLQYLFDGLREHGGENAVEVVPGVLRPHHDGPGVN